MQEGQIFSSSQRTSLSLIVTRPLTTPFSISLPTLPIYDEMGRLVSGGPDYYINPEDGKAVNKIVDWLIPTVIAVQPT